MCRTGLTAGMARLVNTTRPNCTLPSSPTRFGRTLVRARRNASPDGAAPAELPGIDPDKEVDVSVSDGILTIRAERKEEQVDKTHSEFRYGVFSRRIVLPADADDEHIQASYDQGILEVVVDLLEKDDKKSEKHISISHTRAAAS
jgi:hypothetical protein